MNLTEHIETIFSDSISLKGLVAKTLAPTILMAGQMLSQCLSSGGKVLSCGNGGSACDAAHFALELSNRFIVERDGFSAIALNVDAALLTAIANDYDYQNIFARQIKALGKKDDVLLAISTSGNSQNVVQAIIKAHECGMKVIALTGRDGGAVTHVLNAKDIEMCIPSKVTPRIQEMHILIIHCLCEIVDKILVKKNEA